MCLSFFTDVNGISGCLSYISSVFHDFGWWTIGHSKFCQNMFVNYTCTSSNILLEIEYANFDSR